jgi:NIMA (never in mitosis gene a)-related kinase
LECFALEHHSSPLHVLQIRYNEAFLIGAKLCTVMEFAPYGDLRYYISKGTKLRTPFPEEAIWRILLQLCM